MSTRSSVLHPSLVRPRLLAGGERQAVIYNGAAGFTLFMLTRSVIGIIAAVVLTTIGQGVLVVLAKRDPQALAVYSRSLRYQHFYSTAASLDAKPAEVHTQRQAITEYLVFAVQSLLKGRRKHAEYQRIP